MEQENAKAPIVSPLLKKKSLEKLSSFSSDRRFEKTAELSEDMTSNRRESTGDQLREPGPQSRGLEPKTSRSRMCSIGPLGLNIGIENTLI